MTKKVKIKTKKKELNVKKGTLDQKHTECLTKFDEMNNSLPIKREKLVKLQIELNELMKMKPNKYTNDDIRQKAHLMDLIDKLKQEIISIENCTEQLKYIVNTLPILIDYYDNLEIVDDCEEEIAHEVNEMGKKTILSYFVKENKQQFNTNLKISRAKLYENYLEITDSTHRKKSKRKHNLCSQQDCDGEIVFSQLDGCQVCNKCGIFETVLIATDKPNYKEPTQDSGTYAYKRINHLTEILSQLQAKESTDIPAKVFETIQREIKKRNIDKNELDIFKLRKILKKLDYRKYYEHVPHILQIINSKEPPNFSRQDESKIKKMFRDIQKPFAIYCPKDRKNFLNYSYVLHKFCELLDLDEYISYFPLLKNNTKLRQHDKIWNNICKYMRWKFYKSI